MSSIRTIYTDGACSGNPGPGGWAWAEAPEGTPCGSGSEAHTTNQRMEIMAVLEALRATEGPVMIVSDSTYVVNCFRDRWWVRWQSNGWRNSKKEPVANADLWKPLIDLVQQRRPEFRWVKGHSGDRMNDLVDRLAVAASIRASDAPPSPAAESAAAESAAAESAAAESAAARPAQDSLF
jgi:ribonuclease HI